MFWVRGRLACRSAGRNSLKHSLLCHPDLASTIQHHRQCPSRCILDIILHATNARLVNPKLANAANQHLTITTSAL